MQSSITSFFVFFKTPMFNIENTGVLKTRGSC